MPSLQQIEATIPQDKSWLIRMCILDLLSGPKGRAASVLKYQKNLGGDLLALKEVCETWETDRKHNIGESATLFRFLQFIIWNFELDKKLIKSKTLLNRDICKDPSIVKWNQRDLLTLDNETSQWASAAVLCGDRERLRQPPFKLKASYDSWDEWSFWGWNPRVDQTILRQAQSFNRGMTTGTVRFSPEQSEDYCFARAFGIMDAKQGSRRWASLIGHESNRIVEMETMLKKYEDGEVIDSKDHRVVQAIALKSLFDNKPCQFSHVDCVRKTWTLFWDFHAYYNYRA